MLNHLYQIEKKVVLGQNNKAIIIAADENVNSLEIKYDATELSLLAKTLASNGEMALPIDISNLISNFDSNSFWISI